MADVPDENFGPFSQPFSGQNVVSFQTSAASSGAGGGMPVYLDCSSNMTTNMGMMNTAPSVTVSTSNMTTNMGMMNTAPSVAVSTSSSSMVGDSAQNLKYGGNLAADWSQLEHQVLKECLDRYVNEHGIMKYIKIAASIPTKTVRDVAMRCQWLVNKQTTRRRRPAEHHSRKVKDRKDKMVGPSSWSTSQPVQMNTGVSSFVPHHAIQNSQYPSGASEIDRAAQLLLEENNQLLAQIEENLNTFQAQNNPDLFRRVNANLAALVQTMNQMPPTPIRLPQLGVAVNESLASYMFPNFSMEQNLGNSHLKEEPRGW